MLKRKRKPWKWTYLFVPTGDILKAMNQRDLLVNLGELLDTSIKRDDPVAYGSARNLFHKKWDIHPALSEHSAISILSDKKLLELVKRRQGKPGADPYATVAHNRERNGSFVVSLPKQNLQFVIPSRSFLCEMLKANLYPAAFTPTDRTFRFQLLSWCTLNMSSPLTEEELIDILIERGIITLREIVYNGATE